MSTQPGEVQTFKIVNVTNHPGIDGTFEIAAAVKSLEAKGYAIEFVHLRDVTHDEVIRAYADADVAIGKMKIGTYGNSLIESMLLGVPSIAYVRPEFVTAEMEDSGLIRSSLKELRNPRVLYQQPRRAREAQGKVETICSSNARQR